MRERICRYYIQTFNNTEWITCQPVVTKAEAQEYLADYKRMWADKVFRIISIKEYKAERVSANWAAYNAMNAAQ